MKIEIIYFYNNCIPSGLKTYFYFVVTGFNAFALVMKIIEKITGD
ncbi:MAG: hypothetical protein ACXWWC_09980 [Chitinophagaceae bacterium]